MRSQRKSKIICTRFRSTSCTTISCVFIRRSDALPRWKLASRIGYGRLKIWSESWTNGKRVRRNRLRKMYWLTLAATIVFGSLAAWFVIWPEGVFRVNPRMKEDYSITTLRMTGLAVLILQIFYFYFERSNWPTTESLTVPLDDGGRLDQHHHIQTARPQSVEQNPH